MDAPQASKPRILIIPGGGATGIIPAVILAQLEADTGKRVHELFDEIWCSSIGSFIAALLTTKTSTHPKPMTAAEVVKFLEEDVFAHFHSALGIRGILREQLAFDPLMKDSLIPVRILTAEIIEWKNRYWPQRTTLKGFSSTKDGPALLNDVVCASCTVFPLHPIAEQIRGIPQEDERYFIDAGCMASSNCCMNPLRYFLEQNDDSPKDLYFIGNGWVNQDALDESHIDFYHIDIDLDSVFTSWKGETYTGMCLSGITDKLILCNMAGAGVIATERMKEAAAGIFESDTYRGILRSFQ